MGWENPTFSDIKEVYGFGTTLPMTTIGLPLKFDKVKPVKQQLSNVHLEVLLFLSTIRRLSFKEHNKDPRFNTLSVTAITYKWDWIDVEEEHWCCVLHNPSFSANEKGKGSQRENAATLWVCDFYLNLSIKYNFYLCLIHYTHFATYMTHHSSLFISSHLFAISLHLAISLLGYNTFVGYIDTKH